MWRVFLFGTGQRQQQCKCKSNGCDFSRAKQKMDFFNMRSQEVSLERWKPQQFTLKFTRGPTYRRTTYMLKSQHVRVLFSVKSISVVNQVFRLDHVLGVVFQLSHKRKLQFQDISWHILNLFVVRLESDCQ